MILFKANSFLWGHYPGTSKNSLSNLGAHATTVLPNAAHEGELIKGQSEMKI